MDEIAISKFKATCLEVLERVRKTGEPVLVTKFGKPVVQIVPPPESKCSKRWLGSMEGTGRILGDIVGPAIDERDWEVLTEAKKRKSWRRGNL
jgi:prevent-host-death family protein